MCGISLLLLMVLAGCAAFGRNYPDPRGPRHAGGTITAPRRANPGPDTLRIVSFNIQFARQIDSAIVVLRTEPELRNADLVLLQEMDESGTRRIADALGLAWVYYPASYRRQTRRDFGNAILSRWPMVEDAKVILPYLAAVGRTQRTATAVTVRVGEKRVRVYSAHLATLVNSTPAQRRQQLLTMLDDAALYEHVIVGGDMNDENLGRYAEAMGYAWPTRHGPPTASVARLDHIFLRGLAVPDSAAAGTVVDVRAASDHRPIWARAILR